MSGFERWSSPSEMYLSLSTMVMLDPLSALLMYMFGFLLRVFIALLSKCVVLGRLGKGLLAVCCSSSRVC